MLRRRTVQVDRDEIAELSAAAAAEFEFFLSEPERVFVRRAAPGAEVHRLIEGEWVPRRISAQTLDSTGWRKLDRGRLQGHVRKYLVADLTADALTAGGRVRRRLRCSRVWCWASPPLKGGTRRRRVLPAANRSRASYAALFATVAGDDLRLLQDQALQGYEQARERIAGIEQRANYFLAAAGLTTSLVLANAGLLLGTGVDKLSGVRLDLAVAALLAASAAALIVGSRALQATMVTFGRISPNSEYRLRVRRELTGDAARRAYVGDLTVALNRTAVIADWKVARLRQARRWFAGVILGVVALTVIVVIAALDPASSAGMGG